jgi:outer membrane receptor for ferrienterochelin and colicin
MSNIISLGTKALRRTLPIFFYQGLFLSTYFFSNLAKSESNAGFLDLSLEELLQVNVVTVSKREESIDEAPGVVSVFTSEDIKAFGARNIKDILLRIPNFYMFDSYTFNATGSSLRAGATQHINNHILYLINGRPLRESQNGGRHTDINLMFPINAIERIEVIRGPGSVLYGSNAFSGAINIITKVPKKGVGAGVNVSIGTNDYSMLSANGFSSNENGTYIRADVGKLSEGGAEINAIDSLFQDGSSRLSRDGFFTRLDGGYNGFKLEAMVSELELPSVSGAFRWSTLDEWTHTREYLNIGYNFKFNNNWSSSLNYTLNKSSMDINTPNQIKYTSDGYLYELIVNGHINERVDVVFGMVKDYISGSLATNGGTYKSARKSIYGQLDYRLATNTKITTGAQWNKPDEQDANVSPRIALIHKLDEYWSIKALFAEAYRSPFGTEINFNASFLQGNPDLKPETIQTSELQIIYSNPHTTMSSTFYHSETEDLIGRNRVGGQTTFVNLEQKINYNGIELEGRWVITPNLQFHGNASYQETKDEHGIKDIMIASNTMIKMGLSYTTESGITASIWNNYFGDVTKLEDMPGSTVKVVNPEAGAVNLVSINVVANLGDLLNNPQWKVAEISLFADNLLNEDVWFPDTGFKTVNTYPQSHFRGIFINLSVTY